MRNINSRRSYLPTRIEVFDLVDELLSKHLPDLGFDLSRKQKWEGSPAIYPEARGLYLKVDLNRSEPPSSVLGLNAQFGRKWPSGPHSIVLSGRLSDFLDASQKKMVTVELSEANRKTGAIDYAENLLSVLPNVLATVTLDELISIEKKRYPLTYSQEAASEGLRWPDIDL